MQILSNFSRYLSDIQAYYSSGDATLSLHSIHFQGFGLQGFGSALGFWNVATRVREQSAASSAQHNLPVTYIISDRWQSENLQNGIFMKTVAMHELQNSIDLHNDEEKHRMLRICN